MTSSNNDTPQSVVFVDSNVPDLQDMLDGLKSGVDAFVIDPWSDGLAQIADILAANNLTDLSSISIVAHGADGMIELGNTVLNADTIGQYQEEIAAIGAALQPGGDIQLYGCDVAQDAAGDAFLQQLSKAAGGANIAASSQLVGSAAEGGSWALNVETGTAEISSPFIATAAATYPDLLSLTDNQIIVDASNGESGTFDAGTRVEQFGVTTRLRRKRVPLLSESKNARRRHPRLCECPNGQAREAARTGNRPRQAQALNVQASPHTLR